MLLIQKQMPDIFFSWSSRPRRISPVASAVWRERSRLLLVVHARRAGWTKSKNLVFMERCAAWKQNSVMITTISSDFFPLPFCCQAEPWTQQRLVIKSFATGGSKYARFILVLSFILEGSCGGGAFESARYLESPSTAMDVSRVIWFLLCCRSSAQARVLVVFRLRVDTLRLTRRRHQLLELSRLPRLRAWKTHLTRDARPLQILHLQTGGSAGRLAGCR